MSPVVGIFAHPDDEAFGPAGTLTILAKKRPLYLICVTDGSAGMNSSLKKEHLAAIRKKELLASAKMLGIQDVFFLGYKDGSLSNTLYHEIADKIAELLKKLQPELLITYEPRGVSGHLDHIAVSFMTTFVFEKLAFIKELWYFCITEQRRSTFRDYFIYFPPGYSASEIDKTIDVASVWESKLSAMQQHESQKDDRDIVLAGYKDLPKEENFIVVARDDD